MCDRISYINKKGVIEMKFTFTNEAINYVLNELNGMNQESYIVQFLIIHYFLVFK